MNNMVRNLPGRAFVLEVLTAFAPQRKVSELSGSIDELYAKDMRLPDTAMRLSPLEKVIEMVLHDEFKQLMAAKADYLLEGKNFVLPVSKLDNLVKIWQRIFPDNQILHSAGQLLFQTGSGPDAVTLDRLSAGEKAALYYICAIQYAMPDAVVFIDSPTLFLHPAIVGEFWNQIEALRPDCTFVYNTYDVEFVGSRTDNLCIWIKSFDVQTSSWDYALLNSDSLSDDLFLHMLGTRKPVMFIEGDATHSIDAKLYPLVFPQYHVRPLGSCNKVIESTRSFNDQRPLHHLDSHGIVDRDRRTEAEVGYLRRKGIMVPDVAEVENIFMLEGVIRVMARRKGRDADHCFERVKTNLINLFGRHKQEQLMMHVRHIVKRQVEYKADAKFTAIGPMENHLRHLVDQIRPREIYNKLAAEFQQYMDEGRYSDILRVFNYKPMLSETGVTSLLGYQNVDKYIAAVLNVLKGGGRDAKALRKVIADSFGSDVSA